VYPHVYSVTRGYSRLGTERAAPHCKFMRSGLFDPIFPIRSEASARLMRLKADCLLEAGIMDVEDWLSVYAGPPASGVPDLPATFCNLV
jgi:hypothetical protein